ncbi:hypothetical protein VFPBJ_06557 [Purpureocillium lilacinum]|uniref:BTB domain-containing protein n=1 Tax=Purpureocillium lilacinum TaxID=33203 RepID=A0A179GKM3_PURLI|nr:hypothetical protein VFPBJ_06557 [Purpureocillium lilacinum]
MAAATHDIDPDGDVILQLIDADAPFAVWPNADAKDAVAKEHATPTDDLGGVFANGEIGEDPEQRDDDSNPTTNSVSSSADENVNTPETPPMPAPEVHLRLSSKHLTLASPYFKSMLCGPWKEGDTSGTQPRVLTAESWDQDALLIVMNIIHGQNKKVPRTVDFEMMAKIAVIVDYYQCHEALEVFSDMWLKELKRTIPLPEVYTREAVLWLHISHVLSDEETFRTVTKVLQRHLTEPLHTLDLPIPARIGEMLETFRTESVGLLTDEMYKSFFALSREGGCTYECNLMTLGNLTMAMISTCLFPRPEPPYYGLSVELLTSGVKNLREPAWCTTTSHNATTLKSNVAAAWHGFSNGFRRGWEAGNRRRNYSAGPSTTDEKEALDAYVAIPPKAGPLAADCDSSGQVLHRYDNPCQAKNMLLPTIQTIEKSIVGFRLLSGSQRE